MNITLYKLDEKWRFMAELVVDEYAEIPRMCVLTPPPEMSADYVWLGRKWGRAEDYIDEAAISAQTALVPQTVSSFQARAALHLAGLLEQVETLMQSSETDMLAKLAWQDAQEFKRQSPTVLAMAQALDLTDAQIDALFVTAAGIEA
jgi:hypothetical protein